jgi:hypothetical protein
MTFELTRLACVEVEQTLGMRSHSILYLLNLAKSAPCQLFQLPDSNEIYWHANDMLQIGSELFEIQMDPDICAKQIHGVSVTSHDLNPPAEVFVDEFLNTQIREMVLRCHYEIHGECDWVNRLEPMANRIWPREPTKSERRKLVAQFSTYAPDIDLLLPKPLILIIVDYC